MALFIGLVQFAASALHSALALFQVKGQLDISRQAQANQANSQEIQKTQIDNSLKAEQLRANVVAAQLQAQGEALRIQIQDKEKDRQLTIQENKANRALTEYLEKLKLEAQLMMHREIQALQKWRFEKERELEILKLAILGENGLMQIREQSRLAISQMQEKRRQDNSPTRTLVCDLVEEYFRLEDPYALMALFALPVIQHETSPVVNTQVPKDFPSCEYELEHDLLQFQLRYKRAKRPIVLKTGEWISKYIRGTAAVSAIYRDAYMVPTFFLEIPVNKTNAFFNVAYWESDFKEPQFFPAIEKPIPWRTLDSEALVPFISVLSRLWLGVIADVHYLVHVPLDRRLPPLLPTLLPELLQELPEAEGTVLVNGIVQHYEDLYAELSQVQPLFIADLRLDLVLSLAQLPAQAGALQQLQASLQNWLQPYEVTVPQTLDACLDAVEGLLAISDRPYVDKLNQCLKAVGIERTLDIAAACFRRGVQRCSESKEYESAVIDFDQVLQLDPRPEAYYWRGVAYFHLKNYQSAIVDLDQTIALKPQWSQAYEYRGDTYVKLQRYELALANYHQAIQLGSTSAAQKHEYLQRQWQEQQRIERERQQKAEAAFAAGVAALEQKEFEAAISAFERAGEFGHPEAAKQLEVAQKAAKFAALVIDLGDETALELVDIPAGTFQMGGTANSNEQPVHQVQVAAFQMGQYPVTQKQWRTVAQLPKVKIDLNVDPSKFKGDDRPVEQVSWDEAVEFCARLSQLTERNFRPPTEAEWEYACRAGTSTAYSFGDSETQLGNYAWFSGNANSQTQPVGSKEPNTFGLYDMHGNVWEWCEDHWHDNYNGAPTDGSAWVTGGNSERRVRRGGSWDSYPGGCRSAFRYYLAPASRYYAIGFRVVCSAPRTL